MLNPGPFCRMMEERKRSLIKWPSPTVDKTCREQTRICRLTRREIFLKPIKYEQVVSHAKNKLHFFFSFFGCCCLFCFFYREFLTGKLKRVRLLLEWKCAQRRKDRYKRRQTDVVEAHETFKGETESLYGLGDGVRSANPFARGLIGSLVKGFNPVLASHLHLLIKCHNNMIFNFQRASPPLLTCPRDQRPGAEGKMKWAAELHRIHLHTPRESGGQCRRLEVSQGKRGNRWQHWKEERIKAAVIDKMCD